MDKKRKQILINEDNLDQFIRIDLRNTFNEIQKEKFDNNFDLERQFRLERNRSRNFRIYGRISSTAINCDNLTLEIYSDEGYNNLYTTTQTSSLAFNTDNIFRKKDGKYLIELNNYPFNVAYIRLVSDNFYYEDQLWEQRLVFFDADGNFASYGTETVDINILDESSIAIENNFPFFYNKHWIRLDLDVKEEKPRKVSFSSTGNEINEGEVLDLTIFLNEPSPFGNETCILNLESPSMNFPYYYGQIASQTLDGESESAGILFRNVGENLAFYIGIDEDAADILSSQPLLTLQNGDYQGTYEILQAEELIFNVGQTNEYIRWRVVLNTPYNPDAFNADPTFSDSNTFTYYLGDVPDITVLLSGNQISFPHSMSWEENEQEKSLQIVANDDLQIELREEFTFTISDLFRLEDGLIPVSSIFIIDDTPKGVAKFKVEGVFKNGLFFEGRRANNSNYTTTTQFRYSSPSVLRNGALWQNINQEFYPTESLKVVIENKGLNTVIPENPALDIQQEFVLLAGEEVELNYDVKYQNFIPMKVKATYTGGTLSNDFESNPYGEFLVNGVPLPTNLESGEFLNYHRRFKSRLNGGSYDFFNLQALEKDFNVVFDDSENSMTFTAKDGGTFINIEITIQGWVVEVIEPFNENPQIPLEFILYSNTSDLQCKYDISFKKTGYRTMTIPSQPLNTSSEGVQYYLNNVIGQVLAPYDQGLGEAFYINRSIYEGGSFYGLGNVIPQSNDILVTLNEGEGEQGYGGTVMPLAEKVYTRHAVLLSDNALPNSRLNLTTYGRFNNFGELVEPPFWSTNQINCIEATREFTVTQPTKKVIDIIIPTVSPDDVSGTRYFDFAINGDSLFSIGKISSSSSLNANATFWWENGNSIKVCNPDTYETFAGLPSFQEVVEIGDEEGNLGGLVTGNLIEPDRLRLKSNFSAQDFTIQNVVQYGAPEETGENLFNSFAEAAIDLIQDLGISDQNSAGDFNFATYDPNMGYTWSTPNGNTDDSFFESDEELVLAGLNLLDSQVVVLESYIRSNVVVPNLLVGDLNIGRNGLGGFSFEN